MTNRGEDAGRMMADAIVVGAGPAGSAAAIVLARSGLDVVLADRAIFPRDKICGDALIPDALAALETLGLLDRVLAIAYRVHGVQLHAPGGRLVRLRGEGAVLSRRLLDDMLRRAAVEAGACFLAPYRAVEPIVRDGRSAGVRLRHAGNARPLEVHAPWTVLATGAAATSLRAFGVCERLEASGTAARVYVHVDPDIAPAAHSLTLCAERQLAPGYGWVFPAGPSAPQASGARTSVFNIGVGVFHDTRRREGAGNLRALLARFVETFEPARVLSEAAISSTRLMGASLRTGLTGATLARPGLLVAGEAAGTTYSFSGEGIGKALETGMLAGHSIADAVRGAVAAGSVAAQYRERVETTFRDRFRAYKAAQDCLEYPAVADLIVRRANSGRFVREQLEGLFNETTSPKALFSAGGLIRGLVS